MTLLNGLLRESFDSLQNSGGDDLGLEHVLHVRLYHFASNRGGEELSDPSLSLLSLTSSGINGRDDDGNGDNNGSDLICALSLSLTTIWADYDHTKTAGKGGGEGHGWGPEAFRRTIGRPGPAG